MKPIPGELYAVGPETPIVWPLGSASYMVEVKIQIPSTAGPGESGGGHRRSSQSPWKPASPLGNGLLRRAGVRAARAIDAWNTRSDPVHSSQPPAHDTHPPSTAHGPPAPGAHGPAPGAQGGPVHAQSNTTNGHADEHQVGHGDEHQAHVTKYITAWLFDMKDDAWQHAEEKTFAVMNASAKDVVVLRKMRIADEEYNRLLEIQLDQEPLGSVLVITTDSEKPLPVAIQLHSLGWLGPYQVVIAGFIMCVLFGLIMTEVGVNHTLPKAPAACIQRYPSAPPSSLAPLHVCPAFIPLILRSCSQVLHRTMAAMIGATCTLVVLALQNRVPSLSSVVSTFLSTPTHFSGFFVFCPRM